MTSSNIFSQVGKGPTGVIKSVLDTARTDGGRRDEIFVDIVERISCTFNTSGYVQASQIDGAIQVGSLLNGLRRPIKVSGCLSRGQPAAPQAFRQLMGSSGSALPKLLVTCSTDKQGRALCRPLCILQTEA